jgi:small nuclear ribonucleoprotein (snRNP)-like protein
LSPLDLSVQNAFLSLAVSLLQGTLKGFDQATNVILEASYERVYTSNGVEQVSSLCSRCPTHQTHTHTESTLSFSLGRTLAHVLLLIARKFVIRLSF